MTIAKTPAEVLADVLARYTADTGKTLQPADPRRILLNGPCEKIAHQYALIELADRRNLPVTSDGHGADGTSLDNLGTFVGQPRSGGEGSTVTIRYTRPTALVPLVIAQGHRTTTPDAAFIWATDATLTLGVGVLTGTVAATCVTDGPDSNDLPPGSITILVDPLAGVTCTNTTTTDGGKDEQTDDEYRPSVIAAPDGFTTCGPRSAYEQKARAANSFVYDASCLGPDDPDYLAPAVGEVAVFLLLAYLDSTGALTHLTDPVLIASIVASVQAALTADEDRPIGDRVTVGQASEAPYTVEVEYWIHQDNAGRAAEIQAAVIAAQDAYMDWQESKIGRDIDPTELHGLLFAAEARRINIIAPTYQDVERSEAPRRDGYEVAPLFMGFFR